MQTTANFLQLDQMTTIAPIKHFQKHVGAHSDDKMDKLFSFSVSFLSFVWLSNFRKFFVKFFIKMFIKTYIKLSNEKQIGITKYMAEPSVIALIRFIFVGRIRIIR